MGGLDVSIRFSGLAGIVSAALASGLVFAASAHGSGTPGHAELYERAQQQAIADCAAAQGVRYIPFVGIHALIDGAMQGTTDLVEESVATKRIVQNQPVNPNIALRDSSGDPEKWRRVVGKCSDEVTQERAAFQSELLTAQDNFAHGQYGELTRKGARRSYVEPDSPAGPGSVSGQRGFKKSYRHGDQLPTPVHSEPAASPEVQETPTPEVPQTPSPVVPSQPEPEEVEPPINTPLPESTAPAGEANSSTSVPTTATPTTAQGDEPTPAQTTAAFPDQNASTPSASPTTPTTPITSESTSNETVEPKVSATQTVSGAVSVMQAPAYGRGDSDLARYIASRPEYQRALRDYSACLRHSTPAYYAANPDEFANKYTYAAAPAVPQWLRYYQRYAWMKRAIYTGRRCEKPLNDARNETLTKIAESTRRGAD